MDRRAHCMRIPLHRKPRSRRPRSQVCRVDSAGWGSCWAERTGHTTPPPAPKPSRKSPLAFPAASPCAWPPRRGPWAPGPSDPHHAWPTPRGLAGALAAAQEGGRASHFLWFRVGDDQRDAKRWAAPSRPEQERLQGRGDREGSRCRCRERTPWRPQPLGPRVPARAPSVAVPGDPRLEPRPSREQTPGGRRRWQRAAVLSGRMRARVVRVPGPQVRAAGWRALPATRRWVVGSFLTRFLNTAVIQR